MNKNIVHLLEKYKDQNLEKSLLDVEQVMHDIRLIQNETKDAGQTTKDQFNKFLHDLLNVIEQETETLVTELKDKNKSLDSIQRSSEACIAYMQADKKK